jgi:hypothetical protein
MLRPLIFIHRYLAVAVGLFMALWCLSGFVMMYQPFPEFSDAERLASLAPLRLTDCCADLGDSLEAAAGWRIEMLQGRPVLRQGASAPIDLVTGRRMEPLPPEQLLALAAEYARRHHIAAAPRILGPVDIDQWSLQAASRASGCCRGWAPFRTGCIQRRCAALPCCGRGW